MKTCDILKVRMSHLGIDVKTLAENSFVDEEIVNKLVNDEIDIKDVDMIDVEFIESALYCLPGYLIVNKELKLRVVKECLDQLIIMK